MADYEASTHVAAPPDTLFDYLSDVSHLPAYFDRMTSAEPAEGNAVHTSADLDGRTVQGEARFDVDRAAKTVSWGSEGPNDYHGHLIVDGAEAESTVTVTLSTARVAGSDIQDGLEQTVANIKRLVEGGTAS